MSGAEGGVAAAEHAVPGGKAEGRDPGIFARDLWDPRVQTKLWLGAMSLAMDAWLRSGAFLEFMQQGLQTAIAVQRLQHQGPAQSSRTEPSVAGGAEPPDFHSGKKE
jgi:hypothetical protein